MVAPRVIDATNTAEPPPSVVADLPLSELVEQAARKYSVDPLLVHAVIQVESSYNPYAVSPKGAQGLMQLMPATARRFGVSDSFRMAENIDGGVRYLSYLGGSVPAGCPVDDRGLQRRRGSGYKV